MPKRASRETATLFYLAILICALIAILGLLAPQFLARSAGRVTETLFKALDWFWMTSVSSLLLFVGWLALSRHGHLRLGRPEDRPEFSTTSWLSMLFAAGMGAGLLFWGMAEPMTHFATPPIGEGYTAAAARQAMVLTCFHWGLHAWGIYCVGALVLAYFGFRRQTPYLAGAPIREVFQGGWVKPVAGAADLLAVIAVAFGVAASVGQGVMQILSGLQVVLGLVLESKLINVAILVVLVACYMTSAGTGLDRGIKWLSNFNMIVAILLLLFVLLAGPTGFLLRTFVSSLGDYCSNLVGLSLRLYPYQGLGRWVQHWTLTYFIWWIAWAPFVGVFIARISRGRTIREFIIGVLILPTLFSVLWFSIFGGIGIFQEIFGVGGLAQLVQEDLTLSLFSLFDRLPLSLLLSLVALLLLFVFLVTSVDSATFVLGMLTSGGSLDPPQKRKLGWGILLGLLSTAFNLLGDIDVLRAVLVMGAVPYSLVLLVQTAALFRALSSKPPTHDEPASESERQR